jgi:hypothetical protein
MISWLKKHFIPHLGNEHRPHLLRDYSTQSIIIVILFLEIFSFLLPTLIRTNTTGNMAAVLPAVLADLTNQERQSENLSVLAISPLLNQAAQMKADDMATKGYFAHVSPDGKTPWYWLAQVGYQYQYAGENLAVNFADSKDVTEAWMASPAHKENIVKENYTEIGTAVATGIYEGKEATFVVQVYANPLSEISQPAELNKTENGNTVKAIGVKKEPANVLGAETVNVQNIPVQNPTFLQKVIASPRHTTDIVLYIVFGIVVLILLLYILIGRKKCHKNLITNGLIILAIIGAIFSVNYYLSHRDMAVTQSLDYSNQNK